MTTISISQELLDYLESYRQAESLNLGQPVSIERAIAIAVTHSAKARGMHVKAVGDDVFVMP